VTAAGIAVALAAAVANAFAIVFQAQEDRLTSSEHAARMSLLFLLARRRRWLLGIALMVVAWPLQVLALAWAPITVVQPMLATTQLILLAIARARLNERVRRLEVWAVAATVAGIAAVVWAAPRHMSRDPAEARIALPLALVGGAAVLAYVIGRFRSGAGLWFVIRAGLAYAWVDFVNKLLADDLSNAHWLLAGIWLSTTLAFGALAFLQETTALQRRPAVTVTPVIGAIQDPLPVIMALVAGVESWGAGSDRIAPLVGGLALVTVGAVVLGRSGAVARVSGDL
jgi:hypothetical protein